MLLYVRLSRRVVWYMEGGLSYGYFLCAAFDATSLGRSNFFSTTGSRLTGFMIYGVWVKTRTPGSSLYTKSYSPRRTLSPRSQITSRCGRAHTAKLTPKATRWQNPSSPVQTSHRKFVLHKPCCVNGKKNRAQNASTAMSWKPTFMYRSD